jgi:hypothetical protein
MLLFTLSLFAQNYMDTMNTFEGPWRNSEYGKWMATLDFNSDGIDDLFVLARSGPPTPSEVHIFWGGNNFEYNNTPDCIIPMTGSDAGYGIFACGDVNGDGYDDITIAGLLMFDSPAPNFHYFRFYYGGPDAELDFTDYDYEYGYLVGPGYYSDREWFTSCLGDVNGDGCDDMGFILQRESSTRGLGVMLGGTFEMVIVENFIYSHFNIEPVGDLNDDSYADFAVGYLNYSDENITKIYYGDSSLSLTEYEIICNYEQTYEFNGAITVGDMNGDGLPDFLYPITENNHSDNFGLALWGNSFENSTLYPIQCNPVHSSFILGSIGLGQWIKHGDFNGDSYNDFVGGSLSYGLWDGTAAIWLGGENPNGIYDLQLTCPIYPEFSGYFGSNVNVGDYNNDGYDDIAISAPDDWGGYATPGYVTIYAGNPNLTDTTVANESNYVALQPATNLIIYPNPVSSQDININLKLMGYLPKNIENAMVSVYNLKGQKVHERKLNPSNIKNSSDAIKLESLASGFYIATIKINNKRLATSKFIVK